MKETLGTSIVEHFSEVTDRRILLKIQHKLVDIITMALCAVISGADEWVEIAAFAEERKEWFGGFLELPGGIPSHDTFGRVFSLIDPKEFGNCLIHWIRDAFPINDTDIIAIDGKTARRSHDHANGKSPIHMVSAWAAHNRVILGQVKADSKSNEITAIPELLNIIDVKGCIVTIDAMGCQKNIVEKIVEHGGDYVISLKGNQGNLHKDVELLFDEANKNNYKDLSHDTYTSVDGGHGRVETRNYTVTEDTEWFEDKSKWKKLRTFGMVESECEIGDKTSIETRYYISSLPNDAKKFGEAVRDHWSIENSLHWCLDIAFCEDNSRIRKGNAPENLAIIRRFALSLIKQDPLRKIGVKASRKRAGWSNRYLLHLLRLG